MAAATCSAWSVPTGITSATCEAWTSRLTKVDHLASEASVEFAHDGNGNVIAINEHVGSRGIRSHYFWYSHDNRVVRQSLATSDNLIAKESFLDDEGELCLELRTNSAVDDAVDATIALRRGGKLLGLFENDGTEKQRYPYADGRLFGTVDDGGLIQHCHVDGEGSVRAVTHADGSLMQRIDYFPFGEPKRLESSRYDQPFRHHKGEQVLGGFTRQGARFNIARYGRFGAFRRRSYVASPRCTARNSTSAILRATRWVPRTATQR